MRYVIVLASLVVCTPACTGPVPPKAMGDESELTTKADGRRLVSELKRIRPGAEVGELHATPIPGIVGVSMPGGNTIYGTANGSHVIAGDLYALEGELVNLTELGREARRRDVLAALDVSDLVVFPAARERRQVLNVFVDVDCGYCRMLQADMAEINGLGLEVRYLAYPRAGLGSPSYDRMVSAWCAADRAAALAELMLENEVPARSCDSPVAAHFALAKKLGIHGTPGIVRADGRLLKGYVSATDLLANLDL